MWPKPLPNHWVIGATIGVAVDSKDHVWIIHRASSLEAKEQYATAKPPAAQCCAAAPPVLEFNAAGDLVGKAVSVSLIMKEQPQKTATAVESVKDEPLVKRFLEVFRGDLAQVKPAKGE